VSTLPDIAEAMCKRVAARDIDGCRSLALQMAAKMGAPRGPRIERAFSNWRTAAPVNMKHWAPVVEPRASWTPEKVAHGIDRWLQEAQFCEAMVAAGEKVLPLLLAGETRCGKTSSLAAAAIRLGVPVYRVSIGSVIGSHVGETANLISSFIREAVRSEVRAVWLMDEIDAISPKRKGSNGAEDERSSGVAALLTEIESLPPDMLFCATTNTPELMDPAIVARFHLVGFPAWEELEEADRLEFASSHGYPQACEGAESYAGVVQAARRHRVDAILTAAKSGKPRAPLPGDTAELFPSAMADVEEEAATI